MHSKTAIVITSSALAALSCAAMMTKQERSASDLESELAVAKKRAVMIEKKNALLEAENSDHRSAIRRMKNDYAVLKTESDARIRDLTGMNARLKADYLETSARLSAVITGLEKKVAEKSDELARTEAALQDVRAAAEQMKGDLKIKETELARAEKKNRELAVEIEKMKAVIERSDSLLNEREADLRSLRGEIDALNASLKEKNAEISGLKAKLDSAASSTTGQK